MCGSLDDRRTEQLQRKKENGKKEKRIHNKNTNKRFLKQLLKEYKFSNRIQSQCMPYI